jgi:hypothetical protein
MVFSGAHIGRDKAVHSSVSSSVSRLAPVDQVYKARVNPMRGNKSPNVKAYIPGRGRPTVTLTAWVRAPVVPNARRTGWHDDQFRSLEVR